MPEGRNLYHFLIIWGWTGKMGNDQKDGADAQEIYDRIYEYTKQKVTEWYSQPDIVTSIFDRIPISGEIKCL